MIAEALDINAEYAYNIEKWCVAVESLLKKYGYGDSEFEELSDIINKLSTLND